MAAGRNSREDTTRDRAPFACAHVCTACGYLRRPEDSIVAHPLRTDPEVNAAPAEACTHCGAPASSSIDLADTAVARALLDAELYDLEHTARLGPVLGYAALGTAAAGMGAALVLSGAGLISGVATIGWAGTAWFKAAVGWKKRVGRPNAPRRWFRAPEPRPPLRTQHRVVLRGDPLYAPLSGRRCLAFEVGVRWANAPASAPQSFALLEQCVGPLLLDGETLDPRSVRLDFTAHDSASALDLAEFVEREAAHQYLASRGLTTTDGEFAYSEALLTEATLVDVDRDDQGGIRLRPSAPALPMASPESPA